MRSKRFVWSCWAINALISSVYCGLALATFNNLDKYYGPSKPSEIGTDANASKTGLLAACILGFIMVAGWLCFSFLVLLGRLCGGGIYSLWGIMVGTCLHTALFQLLAGLVLNSASDKFEQVSKSSAVFNNGKYMSYAATFGLSYVQVASYVGMFLLLLFNGGVMQAPGPATAPAAAAHERYEIPPSSETELSASGSTLPAKPRSPKHGGFKMSYKL